MTNDPSPPTDPAAVLSAFDAIPAALVAFAGPNLRVAAVNLAARDVAGPVLIVGRRADEALTDLEAEPLLVLIERVQERAETVAAGEWLIRRHRPDGGVDDALLDVTLVPWRRGDGSAPGVMLHGWDVTAATPARRGAAVEAVAADRAATAELQRALLPAALPVLPGVRTAVRHLPAGIGAGARGDWFDVIPRPDGTVGLVVGDVVGRGVDALAATARMRGVLAERLAAGAPLGAALATLDAFAATIDAGRGSSVMAAVLEQSTGRLSYCTAGHPPPLVAGADGVVRFLSASGARPLGLGSGELRLARSELAPHEMVVLYSDGVLTRPDRTPMQASAELARVVADATAEDRAMPAVAPPEATERVCARVSELLVGDTGLVDDVTLLVAQRVTAAGPLHLERPTVVETVRSIRPELAMWLLALGAESEDVVSIQHAVGELVTNAIEHAPHRDDGSGCVVVDAVLDGQGVVHVDVTDDGRWREPDLVLPFRGNGLAMAGLLADDLRVRPGPDGTSVRVSRRLGHAVPPAPWRFDPPPDLGALGVVLVASTLVLKGAVDVEGAGKLRDDLLRHTRAGMVAMTVELGGVTHLCSSGVEVLYEAVERAARQNRTLRLHAPAGSLADHVLTVAELAHESEP